MLTVFKVSSLACKCVFYRPEHNVMQGTDSMELKCKTEIYQRIEFKE